MMLKERINDDFMKAYKAKDTLRAEILKLIKSAIQYKEVEFKSKQKELTDDDVSSILKTEVKKHKESIDQYVQAGRHDAAEKEEIEMKIIQEYLPEPMPFDEVYQKVKVLLEQDGEKSSMGQLMKEAFNKLQNNAESDDIKEAVNQLWKNVKNS
jgi:uncharacterized protein YqeY